MSSLPRSPSVAETRPVIGGDSHPSESVRWLRIRRLLRRPPKLRRESSPQPVPKPVPKLELKPLLKAQVLHALAAIAKFAQRVDPDREMLRHEALGDRAIALCALDTFRCHRIV